MPSKTDFVRPIIPKKGLKSEAQLRSDLRKATKRVCDQAAEELNFLFETWNHKPKVSVKVSAAKGEIKGTVTVDDKVFGYLNDGTKSRWALMSSDFVAKTKVNSLRSGPGIGGPVLRGKSQMMMAGFRKPLKGIAARNFTTLLNEKYGPIFISETDAVMRDAVTHRPSLLQKVSGAIRGILGKIFG